MQFSNGQLLQGDCKDKLAEIDDNSVDLIATDPPYGYAFMNKDWDRAVVSVDIWRECLRVLKPGAFAFVMSAPRQDVLSRMIVNLEDAGFQTGFTSMYWAYASGFPKAGNVSKIVDKKLGKQRMVIGSRTSAYGDTEESESNDGRNLWCKPSTKEVKLHSKIAVSDQAKKLDGSYLGFQPKPAVEVILVVMKPLSEKNYTGQAMDNGKGITWLDDCRIPFTNDSDLKSATYGGYEGNHIDHTEGKFGMKGSKNIQANQKGRFPANLLVSDDALNDGNITKSNGHFNSKVKMKGHTLYEGGYNDFTQQDRKLNDSGSFSRYFDLDAWDDNNKSQFIITPKASKSEKNKGLENFTAKFSPTMGNGIGGREHDPNNKNAFTKNTHPTVKPVKLFKYLVTLGSRENDVILDPFIGSGTTALACNELHRRWIGIERNPEYVEICKARLVERQSNLDSIMN